MIFFDAKKAFDRVWDIGVLHKAMKDGLPAIFCKFLRTYLSDKTMQVRIEQNLSKTIQLNYCQGYLKGLYLHPPSGTTTQGTSHLRSVSTVTLLFMLTMRQ